MIYSCFYEIPADLLADTCQFIASRCIIEGEEVQNVASKGFSVDNYVYNNGDTILGGVASHGDYSIVPYWLGIRGD